MIDGTEQRERRPSALSPDTFRVDETSFGRLVAMGEGYASHLRLHEATGESQQTWAELFNTDEVLVLGAIVGYDPKPIRNWLLEDFEAVPEERLAKAVLKLSATLDGWYRKLHLIDADGARAVGGTIALAIERQLADDMQWLAANYAPEGWKGDVHGYGRLDAAWFQKPSTLRRRESRTNREMLRGAFFAMLDTVDRAKEAAQERIPDSLTSRTHDPAAGLYTAFLQLFQGVQQHVNGFTARHTSFYYDDVLQMKPRRAQPDSVHLVCEAVAGMTAGVRIPAGTVFAAGKDSSLRPIEFISTDDLVVTDAKVVALSTLRLERAPLVLGDDKFDCVKRIKADKPASIDAGGGALPFWPIFGGGAGQGAPAAPDADFGLAIASPALLLKEGQRDVRITLQLRNTAENGGLWARMADGSSLVQWQFVRALPMLFRICFTTAEGWWEAKDCFVARRPDTATGLDGLELTIRLPPEAPSITGCVAALHGAGWNTHLPVVRIGVRQDAALCAYSLLDDAMLEQAVIETRVRGVRDIVIANQYGRLDPSTPFTPFGPMPQPGSYLVFGSPEAAGKNLQRVRLNVEWSGLPQGLGGFPEHYEAYDSEFPNLGFKAKMSVLQDGAWRTSAADPEGRPVFVERPGGRQLAKASRIVVAEDDLHAFYQPSVQQPGEPFVYDVACRSGFFRLELREPRAGFGHAEYPQVLTRVVTANARRKKNPLPMPKAPYTPTIERVTLDYEARTVIHLAQPSADASASPGFVYHLHPFGLERIHPGADGPFSVLPEWTEDGNLFIGLMCTDLQGALSLLFELRGESAEPLLHRTAKVTWAYLKGDRWITLPTARLLSDGTAGFLTSGIVVLDLPGEIDKEHTVMPSGMYWLRVSANVEFDSFASLYNVRAQALTAVRSPKSPMPQDYAVLPEKRVSGPVESIPGLARVAQAGTSFGMRPAESNEQLQVRTGERLKHKNRALLPWDFERLVLERFPSVFKVRCFPNLRAPDASKRAGDILVVVVPALGVEDLSRNAPAPRLNAIELENIESYLVANASPFARVTVRNATYERIQVRCAVEWKRGANIGFCQRRLNQILFDFLSPWNDNGYRARFEWVIRREDVEARIREYEDVQSVASVSLVHVAASDGGAWSLGDTARPKGAEQWDVGLTESTATGGAVSTAVARWPWSIAVPMRTHLIETLNRDGKRDPVPTGIERLAIGSTFVVGGVA